MKVEIEVKAKQEAKPLKIHERRNMKSSLLLLFISTYTSLAGQDIRLRDKTLQTVKEIDENKKQPVSFSTSPNNVFTYETSNGRFIKLIHRFEKDNAKTEQLFYIHNDELIYSTETEILFFGKDSSSWRGTYFFANGKLKDYETLGHGKSELDNWKPEEEVIRNYKRTKNVVVAYTRQKDEPK